MKRNAAVFFVLISLFLSLLACSSEQELSEKTNIEMATEIVLISTSIEQTLAARNTATALPSDTPTATREVLPSQTASATQAPILISIADEGVATASREVRRQITPTPLQGTATPDMRLPASDWRDWPIVPQISDNASDIYWRGVEKMGTAPHFFSKIGDCHSYPNVFMGIYDTEAYILSTENLKLQAAIDFFKGSFASESYAVHNGMNAAAVLTDAWADEKVCLPNENSIECELRIHNPSIMFVNLGSNWSSGSNMDVFYGYIAEIIETLINRGVLPILTSKADNAEGGNQINETLAQAALDYDIPYYNFWPVAQGLANQGLDIERNDGVHLSVVAWNWRNFYALETLHAVGVKLGLFSDEE